MLHRRAARVDANHADVVRVARECGASVLRISGTEGACDLLVGFKGVDALWEVKASIRHRLNPAQIRFAAEWKGRRPYCVYDPSEVPKILRHMVAEGDDVRSD